MRVCLILLLISISTSGLAIDRIAVDEEMELFELLGNTYLYTSAKENTSVDEILKLPPKAWEKEVLTGYAQNPQWILIPFANNSNTSFNKVLSMTNVITHKIDYYFVENGVLKDKQIATGLARSRKTKLYNDPRFPVMLDLPANSKVDVLVRISDPMSSINAPFFLMSFDKAMDIKDRDLFFSFLWMGILFLSIVIALFLYISIRQDMFIYYIAFGIATGIIVTSNAGIIFLFLDKDPYQLVTNYYQIGAVIMINFMPRFLNCIVPISAVSSWAWRGIRYIGYIAIGIAILYSIPFFKFSFFFTNLFINAMVSFTALMFLYLLVTLCIATVRKMKRALNLFVVYIIYLGLAFSNIILPLFGVADKGLNGFNYVLAGSIFETVAFMILMAQVTLSIYNERERLNKIVQSNQELMMKAIVKGQEDERNRFAKDLHDGFGQMISSLMLNLRGLEASKSNTEQRNNVFEQSSNILSDMYVELKNICFNLMPQTLIAAGVGQALKEFAARINQSGEIIIEVSIFDMDNRLTEVQEISIYRISQEWINNILKYSDATKIDLQITKDDQEVTLLIEDNGTGFDKAKLENGKGNGWKNIHSRANLIKGEIELDTKEGMKGTTFIMNMPVLVETQIEQPELVI